MREGVADTGMERERTLALPLAYAVNETARCDDVEITLCSLVVVDGLVRVSGLVRVHGRPDVRLGSIPQLAVSAAGGPALSPLAAHVMPHGGMAWVSWLFQHPAGRVREYEGRIERVEVDYRAGGRPPLPQQGPWLFRIRLTGGPDLGALRD